MTPTDRSNGREHSVGTIVRRYVVSALVGFLAFMLLHLFAGIDLARILGIVIAALVYLMIGRHYEAVAGVHK